MPIPELSGGPRQSIRSYELRQGRLTDGQRRALEQHWGQFGVDAETTCLDLDQVFGRRAPRILDVGSGMGDTALTLASLHPENDYLALEVHLPGVGSLVRRAAALGLSNLRVMRADARDVIERRLQPQSIDDIWVLFPDPWLKRRQHKRRLVNREFAAAAARALKDHGRMFIATDIPDLGDFMLRECDQAPGLCNLAGKGRFAPRPAWRPVTKFERRGLRLGHVLRDLAYARSPASTSSAAKESTAGNS